jgi:predicted CXXCH cytochrome family protein
LQDLSAFPDADAALSFFDDGNPGDNTGAGDGFGYRIAATAYNVLLGRDATGFFQAIESSDGARVSERLYIEFTYGGEGLFRQLFSTRLDASGSHTSDPAAASRYLLPGQFNESRGDPGRANEVTVPGWVLHEPGSWAPPAVDGGPPAVTPGASNSFDVRCAGCHFNGMSLTRDGAGLFHARAVPDNGGALDYDGDGTKEEVNVGCESCHGPGSEHVARPGHLIVHPARLASGSAGLVCGRCHARGSGNGTIDGVGGTEYPSRNGPGGVEFPRPGVVPAEFFGQPDGGGILPDFGTQGGFFNPIDLRQDAGSWKDAAGGFGARFDHSRGQMQHYLDHARARHAANSRSLLACWDCHDPHARESTGQVKEPATNNVLCLRCHQGQGDFTQVTPEMVDALASTGTSSTEINSSIHEHIKERSFELVDVSMNLGPDVYANPAGSDQLGRCITCHMPRTAGSAGPIVDDEGFVVSGDISSHTFDNVSPATSEAMADTGLDPLPNSCVECHRGTLRGSWPDYRFKAQ